MSTSIRQQRQALRRQRRQQRQAQRKVRRRTVSPHLSRRVRSSDLNSLDERQRRIAQAILSRRHRARQQQLEQSEKIQSEDSSTEQPPLNSTVLSPAPVAVRTAQHSTSIKAPNNV